MYHQHNDETEETEAWSPISADPVRTVVKNKFHLNISNANYEENKLEYSVPINVAFIC